MVNFQSADGVAGAVNYQVLVDGVIQPGNWTVYKWNGTQYVLTTVVAKTIGSSVGCYPVHPVADLFLYQPVALGYELDTTGLTNGLHTIELQFLDSAGTKLTTSLPLILLINNQSCVATLAQPVLETTPPQIADACGVIHYGTSTSANVALAFTASQPANFANASFRLARGATPISLPSAPDNTPVSSVTSPITSPITATVSSLLGTCTIPGIAGFAAELYVAATMTNGWNRQSQYDAEALIGFVLTP